MKKDEWDSPGKAICTKCKEPVGKGPVILGPAGQVYCQECRKDVWHPWMDENTYE